MKKLLILILCAFLFFGCKTTKYNVKDTYTEKKETKTEIITDIFEKENIIITEEQKIDEFENIIETITTIKLDNGEPIEITTILREIVKGKKEIIKKDSETNNETQISINENIEEKIDIKNIFEDKTIVKSKTPLFIIIFITGIMISIIIVILLVLKKYKFL
jgi:hypothetical protein